MTVKDRATLKSDVDTNINTNGSQAITGAIHNTILNDILDSVLTGDDDSDLFMSASIQTNSQEPTGFPVNASTGEINFAASTLSFVDGSRTFTITPTGANFTFYEKGTLYTKTVAQSVVISNTEGMHHIYFENGILKSTTTFSIDLIYSYCYVAAVYWDATNSEHIYLANERHGMRMDGHTHAYLHQKNGTIFLSGSALNTITVDQSGNDNTHAQFGIDAGSIKDEDILLSLTTISSAVGCNVFYKDGINGYWRKDTNTGFSVLTTGTSRLAWNEDTGATWQKTEATNGYYVLYHIFATNDQNQPYISVMGQSEHLLLADARDAAETELTSLINTGLPFQEFTPIATVLFKTNNTYSNAVKARTISVNGGGDYVDWRFSAISPVTSSVSTHNNLTGRDAVASHPAEAIETDTTNFNKILSSTDTDLLTALETIDDHEYYEYSSSDGASTTTSATYQQKLKMTTASLPAGDYLINWMAEVGSSDDSEACITRVQVDDTTTIFGDHYSYCPAEGQNLYTNVITGTYKATLTAASHQIDIDYRTENAGDTAYIRNARIWLRRLY